MLHAKPLKKIVLSKIDISLTKLTGILENDHQGLIPTMVERFRCKKKSLVIRNRKFLIPHNLVKEAYGHAAVSIWYLFN